jgi:hypothetical protein
MAETLQGNTKMTTPLTHFTPARAIGWGLLGGLLGTVAMDIVLIGASPVLGLNGIESFSVIGDTAARFFALLGVGMTGGVPTGLAVHYLAGPLLGAIFGAAVTRFNALWPGTLKKGVGLAILYVELVSQPLLATPPLLLNMNAPQTAFWYALSFGMHLLWGGVLGAVVSHGLRRTASRPVGR